MSKCQEIMCKFNLYNKDDVKKWILINHPDKSDHPDHDPNITPEIYQENFQILRDCLKNEQFCGVDEKKIKVTKKNRAKIFSCMRKTANFSKIANYHKFDKSVFSPKKFLDDVAQASPKIIQLMKNIENLDSIDQANHGHKFKHFIFSDVKEGGYGAKIVASAFVAAGYNNVIQAKKVSGVKKLKLYIDVPNSEKNVGLLCSNAIYKSTFNEKIKKELLKLFNERPGNIKGEKLRFIIFDSGFKEGIDLFDVKYVHIFEPSMTVADLKQTIGRATRTCGQKGLDFLPDKGWPLYVYNYYLTVPDITSNTLGSTKFITENINKPLKDDKDEDVLIFKNIEKFNDATMLYSEFDRAMNNLSLQLLELAPLLSTDYILTKNLHNIEDLNEKYMEKDYYLMGGTKKNLFKNTNKKSKFFNMDIIKCKGKCGQKSTHDVPIGVEFMKKVYKKYNHPNKFLIKNNLRKSLCNYMSSVPQYCEQLNYEWALRYSNVPNAVEKNKNLDDLDLEGIKESNDDLENDYENINYAGAKNNNIKTPRLNSMVPSSKLNFLSLRDFIKTKYNSSKYIWDPIKIENRCVPKPGEKPKKAHEIEFNQTQNFLTNFFCPESPYKGMLLWHSVGTGKTCTGVATATTSFEEEGYNILWVTRTTLRSDVWKNIFDQICHVKLQKEVKSGLTLPEKLNQRKKMLSELWLEPMSYKQFSNLLLGKNKIYNILKERNGSEDILKKTLIIIDEAHKLYGGDLKAVERPDTNIMEDLIMNSYKLSGKDSCKLLVMTATPFTNSPLELFKLINLFYTNESEKITTDKEEFKKQYMNQKNILSESGVKNLANKLSGYISYLNREKDPTQFAQPIMINVPILMTHIYDNDLRKLVYLNKKVNNVNNEILENIKVLKIEINNLKEELREKKMLLKESKNAGIIKCNEKYPDPSQKDEKKKCLEQFKEEYNELNNNLKELIDKISELQKELDDLNGEKQFGKNTSKEMKNKLKLLKDSLIQEYILYKKCAHLKYIELKNTKSSTKSSTNSSTKSSTKKYSKTEKSKSKSKSNSSQDKKSKKKTTKKKLITKNVTNKKTSYNSFSD
jgi:superfamily II DNA or RNA helicase